VDLVLDGGLCTGEGSTTVDITEPYWRIIKLGAISEKEIAEILDPVNMTEPKRPLAAAKKREEVKAKK